MINEFVFIRLRICKLIRLVIFVLPESNRAFRKSITKIIIIRDYTKNLIISTKLIRIVKRKERRNSILFLFDQYHKNKKKESYSKQSAPITRNIFEKKKQVKMFAKSSEKAILVVSVLAIVLFDCCYSSTFITPPITHPGKFIYFSYSIEILF